MPRSSRVASLPSDAGAGAVTVPATALSFRPGPGHGWPGSGGCLEGHVDSGALGPTPPASPGSVPARSFRKQGSEGRRPPCVQLPVSGLPVSSLPVSGLPCPAQGRGTAQGSREGSVPSDGQLCSYLTTWGSMEGVRPWPGERRVPPGCPAWALQEACPSAGRAGSARKGHLSEGPQGHRVTAHKVLGPVEMV